MLQVPGANVNPLFQLTAHPERVVLLSVRLLSLWMSASYHCVPVAALHLICFSNAAAMSSGKGRRQIVRTSPDSEGDGLRIPDLGSREYISGSTRGISAPSSRPAEAAAVAPPTHTSDDTSTWFADVIVIGACSTHLLYGLAGPVKETEPNLPRVYLSANFGFFCIERR